MSELPGLDDEKAFSAWAEKICLRIGCKAYDKDGREIPLLTDEESALITAHYQRAMAASPPRHAWVIPQYPARSDTSRE